MIRDGLAGEIRQIKVNIEKWLSNRFPTSDEEAKFRDDRSAEELIWKFQERYGYKPVKPELDQ